MTIIVQLDSGLTNALISKSKKIECLKLSIYAKTWYIVPPPLPGHSGTVTIFHHQHPTICGPNNFPNPGRVFRLQWIDNWLIASLTIKIKFNPIAPHRPFPHLTISEISWELFELLRERKRLSLLSTVVHSFPLYDEY